jgi:hypothetical protein
MYTKYLFKTPIIPNINFKKYKNLLEANNDINKQLLTYTTNINDITFETSDKELPNGMNILNVIIKKDIKTHILNICKTYVKPINDKSNISINNQYTINELKNNKDNILSSFINKFIDNVCNILHVRNKPEFEELSSIIFLNIKNGNHQLLNNIYYSQGPIFILNISDNNYIYDMANIYTRESIRLKINSNTMIIMDGASRVQWTYGYPTNENIYSCILLSRMQIPIVSVYEPIMLTNITYIKLNLNIVSFEQFKYDYNKQKVNSKMYFKFLH